MMDGRIGREEEGVSCGRDGRIGREEEGVSCGRDGRIGREEEGVSCGRVLEERMRHGEQQLVILCGASSLGSILLILTISVDKGQPLLLKPRLQGILRKESAEAPKVQTETTLAGWQHHQTSEPSLRPEDAWGKNNLVTM
ncbi:hypothetical protein OYC64_017444 [Pagothenia borchgrevinki]|uniref:Uncharacterized protein n=1 Tax=Pagothenia borchgrevinki TaxID=8213 RepID=A0ABD2GM92_PAGBO